MKQLRVVCYDHCHHQCPPRSCLDLIFRNEVMKNSSHANTTAAAHNDAKNFPLFTSAGVEVPIEMSSCRGLLDRGLVP